MLWIIQLACTAIHTDTAKDCVWCKCFNAYSVAAAGVGLMTGTYVHTLSTCDWVQACLSRVCVCIDRFFFWIWTGVSVTAGSQAPCYLSQSPMEPACCPAPLHPSIHPWALSCQHLIIQLVAMFLPSIILTLFLRSSFNPLIWVCIYLFI